MFKLFIPYVHLYSLLFHEQRRCCFVRKVDNKIQGSLHAKQDYQEDKIKVQKKKVTKYGTKLVRHISLISGNVPDNPGRMFPLTNVFQSKIIA